jgi:hypothetical protein
MLCTVYREQRLDYVQVSGIQSGRYIFLMKEVLQWSVAASCVLPAVIRRATLQWRLVECTDMYGIGGSLTVVTFGTGFDGVVL